MDPRQYNDKSNSGRPTHAFNCGGFALGCFTWYIPKSYYEWKDEEFEYDEHMALEDMAQDILNDFDYLVRIKSPKEIPSQYKVIGFRVGSYDDFFDDFHFIVRYEGKWWEKMGYMEIDEFEDSPENDEWGGRYNSEVVWFYDPTNEIDLAVKAA